MLGAAAGLVLAELALRGLRGGAVHLPIYAAGGDAGVRLAAGVTTAAWSPRQGPWTVEIDDRGLRAPSPDVPVWVLAGDSAAFGVGVAGEATLAARLSAKGLPTANAGVPGFGIPDALAHAAPYAHAGRRVLLLVNPVDDALPVEATVTTRFEVAGRWLVTRGTAPWARALLASPLSRSLLFDEVATFAGLIRHGAEPPPRWTTDPDGGAACLRALGQHVRDYADTHAFDVAVVWLPFDAVRAPGRARPSPWARTARGWDDRRAQEGLAAGLGDVPLLVPALDDVWLPGDVHLSPTGADALADAILAWLPAR